MRVYFFSLVKWLVWNTLVLYTNVSLHAHSETIPRKFKCISIILSELGQGLFSPCLRFLSIFALCMDLRVALPCLAFPGSGPGPAHDAFCGEISFFLAVARRPERWAAGKTRRCCPVLPSPACGAFRLSGLHGVAVVVMVVMVGIVAVVVTIALFDGVTSTVCIVVTVTVPLWLPLAIPSVFPAIAL